MCGASLVELSITPELTVHGAGFDEPFSKPGLPSNCWVVPPPPAVVTVRLTFAVWVLLPPVPVIVTLYVPVVIDEPIEIVIWEEPEPGAAIEVGLKVALAPVGNPEAESETAELKLPEIVVEMVAVPLLP